MNIGKNDKAILKVIKEDGSIDCIDLDEYILIAKDGEHIICINHITLENIPIFLSAIDKLKEENIKQLREYIKDFINKK